MLDKDVTALIELAASTSPGVIHFTNLSRGLLANECIPEAHESHVLSVRIPSTWCEQKLWSRILESLPPELWLAMAMGDSITVHDKSERPRQTRAMWQGLSWIRYAVRTAWGLPHPHAEISRSGMNVTSYWDYVYRNLPSRTRNVLKYYKNYSLGRDFILGSCPTCDKGTQQ